jgi:hypothetical protein
MAIDLDEFEDVDLNDFEEVTPTGLPSINEPTTVTPPNQPEGIQVPKPVQSIAQQILAPTRATRGVAVGIKNFLEGVSPAGATSFMSGLPGSQLTLPDLIQLKNNVDKTVERATAAYQPGFEPQPGEEIPAFLGEAAGVAGMLAPLAAAAPAVAGAVGATSPLAVAGVTGAVDAATGMGLTALQQTSEKGTVSPGEVGLVGAISGAIPFGKPIYQGIKGAATKLLPEVLAWSQKAPKRSVKIRLDDPEIMKVVQGTEESLKAAVDDATTALNQIREEAGTQLRKVKVDLGLEVAPEEEIAQLATRGSPEKIAREEIKQMGGVEIGVGDDFAQEVAQAYEAAKKVPESQRLKYLYNLKNQINEAVTFRPGVVKQIGPKSEGRLKTIAGKADKDMLELPGGDRLKEGNEQFHKAAGLYDELQKKLETPGMAEDSLAKIFRGDLSVITEGKNREVQALLDKLDEMAGKPVTKQIWREMTVKHFKKGLGRGLGSFLTGQVGLGIAGKAAFASNPILAAGALATTAPLVSPRIASMSIAAGQKASPYINRFLSTISNPKLQSAIISAIATPKERKK